MPVNARAVAVLSELGRRWELPTGVMCSTAQRVATKAPRDGALDQVGRRWAGRVCARNTHAEMLVAVRGHDWAGIRAGDPLQAFAIVADERGVTAAGPLCSALAPGGPDELPLRYVGSVAGRHPGEPVHFVAEAWARAAVALLVFGTCIVELRPGLSVMVGSPWAGGAELAPVDDHGALTVIGQRRRFP